MADTPGIISNTIMINLGDSLNNINEVKKGLKDVRAALKTMEKEQGRSAMVNGTLMDVKELRNVIQRLQSDMKALQGTSSVKSKATKGIDDAVEETEKKLKTLQGKVREAMTNADKAWQDGTGFKGAKQSFNDALNQLTAFKRDLGTLSIGQEKSLYTNLRRGLNDSSASAKVLTERIKELNAEVAKNKARDSVATPKETLPKQPTISSSQVTDGIKEAKANIKAINKDLFEQLQKNNQQETSRTQELRRQKAELEAQLSSLKSIKSTDTKSSNANLLATQNANASKQYWKDQEALRNQRTSQLQGWMQGNANAAKGDRGMDAYDKAQKKSYDNYMSQLASKYNKEDQGLQRIITKYDALNNKLRDYAATNTQISERQYLGMQRQARAYEAAIVKGGVPNNTGISPIIGQSYQQYLATIKPPDYQSFQRQIANAKTETERLYQVMTKTNTLQSRIDFANAKKGLRESEVALNSFNKAIGTSHGLIDGMGRRIRSHLEWIVSGGLITAFAALPMMIENIARETEVLGQKLKQNLELAERYRDNHHGLEEDVRHLGDVAATFAVGYGANVKDVLEMMQVLSRRFKSPEELTYYTNLAMVMHKLDFVAPKKAAEDLEAVILSMGLDFKGAKKFIDEFSVAVEVAA